MKNGKQWAKSLIIVVIGALPLLLSTYTQATWYYVLISISLLFFVLGIISMFQLLVFSVIFPIKRNILSKIVFVLAIITTLTIPYFWINYHESNKELLLENNYEVVDGKILHVLPKNGKFEIEYTFQIGITKYNSVNLVKKEPQSNILSIKYLPSDPNINKPIEE